MMKKEYKVGNLLYGFSVAHRKWIFTNGPEYSVIMPVPGGVEVAHKVAKLIHGGLRRMKGKSIDGAARTGINTVLTFR